MAEQFCLRWNNHQNTVIAVMDTLLQNNILVDVTLAAEGRSLRAHRVVLSACSPYLEMLLSENTDKHPILLLKDVSFHELESMVAYMYRGEVNISQDELGTFLKAAESLQIKGLADGGDEGNATTTSTNSTPAPRVTAPRRPQAPISVPRVTPPSLNRSNNVAAGGLTIEPSHAQRHGSSRVSNSSYDEESLSPRKRRRTTEAPITPIPVSENDYSNAEEGLLQEKIEPVTEPVLMEPKAEYYEEVGPDDNIEDLTLDDDEDPGEGPSGYDNWQLLGEQGGEEYLNNSANQDPNNSQGTSLNGR